MSNIKNRIFLIFALISMLLIIDYSLLFLEKDSISSIENDIGSFVESQLENIGSEFNFIQQHAEPVKITGKSVDIKTGDSVYVGEESENENPEIEKAGSVLAMGVNGTYIDIIGQTPDTNVSKDEFFNFSVSVKCKSSCSNVILTLDPYESMTKTGIDYAKQELENIQDSIEEKNLEWRAGLTEFYLEYMKRKQAGEEHPFAMEKPEMPSLSEILETSSQAKTPSFQIKSAATGTQEKVLPYYIDWRNMYNEDWTTSVKSQGGCNGCWAFGAVAVAESSQMIYNKLPNINIDLA